MANRLLTYKEFKREVIAAVNATADQHRLTLQDRRKLKRMVFLWTGLAGPALLPQHRRKHARYSMPEQSPDTHIGGTVQGKVSRFRAAYRVR